MRLSVYLQSSVIPHSNFYTANRIGQEAQLSIRTAIRVTANSFGSERLTSYLYQRQLQVGVCRSREVAVYSTRDIMNSLPPDHKIVKLDFSNAESHIYRAALETSVAAELQFGELLLLLNKRWLEWRVTAVAVARALYKIKLDTHVDSAVRQSGKAGIEQFCFQAVPTSSVTGLLAARTAESSRRVRQPPETLGRQVLNEIFRTFLVTQQSITDTIMSNSTIETMQWVYRETPRHIALTDACGSRSRLRPRCSLPSWWSWKKGFCKLGRGLRDQLSVPKDLDFGAAFQGCDSTWQFAGYRLHSHRLTIVPDFALSSQFFYNSLGIICTEGLKIIIVIMKVDDARVAHNGCMSYLQCRVQCMVNVKGSSLNQPVVFP